MVHTPGCADGLAQIVKEQNLVPMRVEDIGNQLQGIDEAMDKSNTSLWILWRALHQLEKQGLCERRIGIHASQPCGILLCGSTPQAQRQRAALAAPNVAAGFVTESVRKRP